VGIVNKRILVSVAWAIAGFAVAVGVMAWAFALAGQEISEPATPSLFSLSPTPYDGIDPSPSPTPGTPTPSPSEHDDDNSGPGSDDSGSGSDNSGSGSDNSGSGSSSSGSGSSGSSDRDDD
jgi:uncharacterized membrane protein YgcG